ncbi:hypothetical protein VFPPC_06903 [Pochonia chlamydosporia 170]|uniref:Uncharacterized protein n=1 Tax=Pochonia chlamydosporia 170 TaxID=1380566 RepID=A0A179FAI2_METCM|nr:hypothetical protein VFPPC_06903 [Pochonia chlamydosporia 170]OAQ62474.1 hypothetical protein VFPPC_06903 [Pochonia chlamydosporia 170]
MKALLSTAPSSQNGDHHHNRNFKFSQICVSKSASSTRHLASPPLRLFFFSLEILDAYLTTKGTLKFLEAQVSRLKKVLLVLGNHKFYGLDYQLGLKKAHLLSKKPTPSNTLVEPQKHRWDDPDSALTNIGCTLWSAIPEEACSIAESEMNNFKKITF